MIYSYINTSENWKNSKLCENTPPCGRRVSTQFLVFPISTRVDITVYQHGKCFIFLKYYLVQSYEEAFEKLKEATEIEDIDLLVSKFIEVEDKNFALFNYVNELNNDIEILQEQINMVGRNYSCFITD